MALNINWRFADPQNINVPQSNILPAFNKNIQQFAEIKKAFDKKQRDNDMIQLMTVEAENKLINLNAEKDELIAQYESLSPDEQLAQKTNFENKINELYAEIKLAEKEVIDARMNANQFKTTGTTDFFRWKKDKEYDIEKDNINRDIIKEQTKNERLSDISWQIRAKEAELKRTRDLDKQNELNDEINLLKAKYNQIYGSDIYEITELPGQQTPKVNTVVPKPVKEIEGMIKVLKYENDLENSDDVKKIQDEIDKYKGFNDGVNLQEKLKDKIKELNDANKKKTAAAAAALKNAMDNNETLYNKADAVGLLDVYIDAKIKNKGVKDDAKNKLITLLSKTGVGKGIINDTVYKMLMNVTYKDNSAMRKFIDENRKSIEAEAGKK